jgi:phosphatidylinositol dimannoside acyltransferase
VKEALVDAGYNAGWSLVRHLPESVGRRTFRTLADRAWAAQGTGVRQLQANYARALPDLDADAVLDLGRRGMRSYARYWYEAFRLPAMSTDDVIGRMQVHDEQRMLDLLQAGGVFALGHMGNWDHLGAWAALSEIRVTTVAERLKPEALFERFLAYRQSLGMEVIPLTGSERDPFSVLQERAEEGNVIALLADRDITRSGLEVDFLGAPATFPPGPALLSLRTGVPLVPVATWFDATHTHLRPLPVIEPPSEGRLRDKVQVMTQAFADVLGEQVREHPEDWHMLQPFWLDDVQRARAQREAQR